VPGFLFLTRSKFIFDKRLKTKIPKIAQQFWVLACDEQIQGKTGQRNPAMVTKKKGIVRYPFSKKFSKLT